MPFDARRFRDLATYLLNDTTHADREAVERTSVGRFYYAMFLGIRRFLRERGVRASTVGTVVLALDAIPDLAGVSTDLEELHALRNRADYNDTNDFTSERLGEALRLVQRIEAEMAPHW